MNSFPRMWDLRPLGSIATMEKKTLDPRRFPAESFDYYSIPAYGAGRPINELGMRIASSKLLVSEGMILFGKLNPRVPKVWHVSEVSARRKIASTEFIPLIPHDDRLDVTFLFFLCWSSWILPKAQKLVSGSTPSRQRVDPSRFLELEVPVPPLEEQRAIAQVLRTVQRAKEQAENVVEAVTALFRSLLSHLFSYGPVAASGVEKVVLQDSPVGAIPADWDVVELDSVFESRLGKMLSPAARVGSNPKPYLRNINVQWNRVDLTDIAQMDFLEGELEKFRLCSGDALVCEGGEVGRTALWRDELSECYFQKAIHRVRPRDARSSTKFFMYHMMHAFMLTKAYGVPGTKTTIAHLPGVKLKALPIPLPTREEQDAVVRLLDAVDTKLVLEQQRVLVLGQLFDSMLHELMTGKTRSQGKIEVG